MEYVNHLLISLECKTYRCVKFSTYERRIKFVFRASFKNTSIRAFGEELCAHLSSVLPVDCACVCVGHTIKKNKVPYKMNLSYQPSAAEEKSALFL